MGVTKQEKSDQVTEMDEGRDIVEGGNGGRKSWQPPRVGKLSLIYIYSSPYSQNNLALGH